MATPAPTFGEALLNKMATSVAAKAQPPNWWLIAALALTAAGIGLYLYKKI